MLNLDEIVGRKRVEVVESVAWCIMLCIDTWGHSRRYGSLSVSTNLQEWQSQLSRTPQNPSTTTHQHMQLGGGSSKIENRKSDYVDRDRMA